MKYPKNRLDDGMAWCVERRNGSTVWICDDCEGWDDIENWFRRSDMRRVKPPREVFHCVNCEDDVRVRRPRRVAPREAPE